MHGEQDRRRRDERSHDHELPRLDPGVERDERQRNAVGGNPGLGERAREIVVDFLPREAADEDPALIRTAANLIPQEIDPLRVIDIVGLDKQADGGTHVLSTAEVGRVRVTGTESKGKGNKRVRIEVADPM